MFEKEAKEDYLSNLRGKVENNNESRLEEQFEETFQRGAICGYNKANEWHYDKNVPCYKTGTYRIIVYDNWREPTIISPTQELEHINGQENHIVAWKEIVIPELKEK